MDADDEIDASSDSSDFYSGGPAAPPSAPPIPAPGQEAHVAALSPPDTLLDCLGATANDAIAQRAEQVATRDIHPQDSSDMELSDESRPETPARKDTRSPASRVEAAAESATSHAGTKRKLSDAQEGPDASADVLDDAVKKRKTLQHFPELPLAIWQRIFCQLSPAMLCRCLRVCKNFNRLLTSTKAPPGQQKDKSTARIVDSEAIWIHSRKTFFPQLPRPLRQHSELEMLKLIGGQTCQFCGKLPSPVNATTIFNCGPGTDGVRVIFPFAVRTCGPCLEPLLRKDVQLLSDPISARLRLGIAHAFRNEEFHFVTETVRQIPPGIPGNLRFSKVYYEPHLTIIQHEEDDAQQLGDGAADEWRKGLYNKGKDAMADSARWEKWEAQLRLGANLAQVLREYDLSSFPHHVQEVQSRSVAANHAQSSTIPNGPHPLPQPVHVFHNGFSPQFPQYQQHPRPPLPLHHQLPYPPPIPLAPLPPQQRVTRNPQEVETARQTRKAEIERRCKELEPPVEPNVLQHMESFQAAMQITTPLTDAAWDMLKPRILAQRESAELAEHTRASQLAALQAAMPSFLSDQIISKPAKEMYDREYEDAQMPLRKRLGEYADDLINGHWVGGKMLSKENVPIFAIQVLTHVRQRYVQDKELDLLADLETIKGNAGTKSGTPPLAPFLSLDNMKWVYDNKVRSFTDVHRKEHFICAGCDEEKKPKWFAFEGLIQHFGAKHTSLFSKGNIVVHWQTAEWPDPPPFHTNPAHWLKMDRKISDFKREHRTKNASQSNHNGHGQTPGAAPTSNGLAPSLGYGPHSAIQPQQIYGRSLPQTPQAYSHGRMHSMAPENGNAGPDHDTQLLKLATDARDFWDALDGVKDLLECIQVQTVLHHTVAKFVEQFHCRPTLDILTDALATHNSMRPLKNVTGLACKSCVATGSNAHSNSYWTRIRGTKFFNTSSLITHFKLMHQPNETVGPLDWVKDMIEVPEQQILTQLLRTPGMDDGKLGLIVGAFPGTFPSPLPRIGTVTQESSRRPAAEAPVHSLLERLGKKSKGANKKKGQKVCSGAQDRDSSNEPLPEPTEDEYNPLRPALVQTESYDPAQFDTDARKTSTPAATAPKVDLNPETLALLQNLAQLSQKTATPGRDRLSRSPSVGRAQPIPGTQYAKQSESSPTRNGQPDIAAILAALTGQTQSAGSPPSARITSDGGHDQPLVEAYPTNSAPYERHDARQQFAGVERAPSQHYNTPSHSALHQISDTDARDRQAAVARSSRHLDENQRPTYAERKYSNGSQPSTQSLHQYQYVYEHDRPYAQPHPQTPMYRDAGPPQYVQMTEREYGPHGYPYERPAPKPLYVDQYGRPLIPIDPAPATVQCLPIPYEHQQQYARPQEHAVYASVAPQPQTPSYTIERHPVYYEQPVAAPQPPRYVYEERASVGRH